MEKFNNPHSSGLYPSYVRVSIQKISSNRFYFNCAPRERVRRCQSNESVIRVHRCDLRRRSSCVIWCLSGGGGGAWGTRTHSRRRIHVRSRVALNETKPLWARGLKKCGATAALSQFAAKAFSCGKITRLAIIQMSSLGH